MSKTCFVGKLCVHKTWRRFMVDDLETLRGIGSNYGEGRRAMVLTMNYMRKLQPSMRVSIVDLNELFVVLEHDDFAAKVLTCNGEVGWICFVGAELADDQ